MHQNIGGLALQERGTNLGKSFQRSVDHEFDIVALSEINIDTTKHHAHQSLHQQTLAYPGAKISYSLSSNSASKTFK